MWPCVSKYQISKGIWESRAMTEETGSVREVARAWSPSDALEIKVILDDGGLCLKVGSHL